MAVRKVAEERRETAFDLNTRDLDLSMPSLPPDANPPAAAPPAGGPGPIPSVVDAWLLGKALGFGVLLVGAVLGACLAVGVVPAVQQPFLMLGAGAAVGAAMVAVWLHGRFLAGRTAQRLQGDGRLLAGHLQSLLAAAFAVKLLVLVAAVLVLRQTVLQGPGKFPELATFCIAFAGASVLCQMATAGYLARAIQPRASTNGTRLGGVIAPAGGTTGPRPSGLGR